MSLREFFDEIRAKFKKMREFCEFLAKFTRNSRFFAKLNSKINARKSRFFRLYLRLEIVRGVMLN